MSDSTARKFYDRISKAYDFMSDASERSARERGIELLGVNEGASVLEIGFGTGHGLVDLARRVGSSGKVTGVDISPGMRDVAASRIAELGLGDRIELLVEETPPIPCADDSFDAISMSFTLELFPMSVIPEALREMSRVLRPGGKIGVVSMSTVEPGEHESLLERTYVWMHTHFPHIVDCQPIPLGELLETNGFSCIDYETVDIFTMPVAIAVAKTSS